MAFCKLNNLLTVFGKRLVWFGVGRTGGGRGAGFGATGLNRGSGGLPLPPQGSGCAGGQGIQQRELGASQGGLEGAGPAGLQLREERWAFQTQGLGLGPWQPE